jgi:hypothetical protein
MAHVLSTKIIATPLDIAVVGPLRFYHLSISTINCRYFLINVIDLSKAPMSYHKSDAISPSAISESVHVPYPIHSMTTFYYNIHSIIIDWLSIIWWFRKPQKWLFLTRDGHSLFLLLRPDIRQILPLLWDDPLDLFIALKVSAYIDGLFQLFLFLHFLLQIPKLFVFIWLGFGRQWLWLTPRSNVSWHRGRLYVCSTWTFRPTHSSSNFDFPTRGGSCGLALENGLRSQSRTSRRGSWIFFLWPNEGRTESTGNYLHVTP